MWHGLRATLCEKLNKKKARQVARAVQRRDGVTCSVVRLRILDRGLTEVLCESYHKKHNQSIAEKVKKHLDSMIGV